MERRKRGREGRGGEGKGGEGKGREEKRDFTRALGLHNLSVFLPLSPPLSHMCTYTFAHTRSHDSAPVSQYLLEWASILRCTVLRPLGVLPATVTAGHCERTQGQKVRHP